MQAWNYLSKFNIRIFYILMLIAYKWFREYQSIYEKYREIAEKLSDMNEWHDICHLKNY